MKSKMSEFVGSIMILDIHMYFLQYINTKDSFCIDIHNKIIIYNINYSCVIKIFEDNKVKYLCKMDSSR